MNFLCACLVALLGHPSYHVRSTAHDALTAAGLQAQPALLASRSLDPEVRHRIGMLLDGIFEVLPEPREVLEEDGEGP